LTRGDARIDSAGMKRTLRLVTISACLASPALAQERPATPESRDRTALTSCLRESASTPRACIGVVAVPCAQGTSGNRAADGTACARRESALWRDRLDAASRALLTRLDAGGRSRFAALQRTWEGFTAQKCAFAGDVAPPARSAVMQAGCDLQEVATRALDVEKLARSRTPQTRSNPPRIER
jgi:hypothetical protein